MVFNFIVYLHKRPKLLTSERKGAHMVLNTVEPWFNEFLYNEVLATTNDIPWLSKSKIQSNLNLTNPYSEVHVTCI